MQQTHFHRNKTVLIILLLTLFNSICVVGQVKPVIVNDVSQLNPIRVSAVITPTSTYEIITAVKNHSGPISIGGGRYSMGGQTATEQTLQIDMRNFNRIVSFSKERKEITVQAGIRWREVIQFIDKYSLSVKIMQTYANFTVGGSLSVNVHGRYVGQGPIILSVKQIKIILANGDLITASPNQNKEIFYGAIGGYGGLGVITEVTLSLAENCKVQRLNKVMDIAQYSNFFKANIKNSTNIIFHNADIYPNNYTQVRAVSYVKTNKPLTIKYRLKPNNKSYAFNRGLINLVSGSSFGKWLRQHILDPIHYLSKPVEWRNYEASYDVMELEPKSRKQTTYVLQEYFIPVNKFDEFYPKMRKILRDNKVNVLNISIRYARKDPGSLLAWAKTDVFAFVIYYKQGVSVMEKEKVKRWTTELIHASIDCKGTFYLPYQIQATKQQFLTAYPNAPLFFKIKNKYDPNNKFRNKLWDAYYH